MTIVFLTGSLQPGCDGVGDYTRLLAGELIKNGHKAAIVSLYDFFIKEEINNIQYVHDIALPVLRLPSVSSITIRLNRAKDWIERFNPEWISLQFVVYAFHPKGLPFNLNKLTSTLAQGRRLHIMFHELWIGMNVGAPVKHVWWGWLQKQLIKLLLFNLKPDIVHTQTLLYQVQLAKLGYKAEYLPLFSNIPVVNFTKSNAVGEVNSLSLLQEISFVIFGTIHPGAPVEEFSRDVSQYAKSNAKKISLSIIGRSGDEQMRWAKIFKSVGASVELIGEQTPERISELLSKASVGISTTPIVLSEKSGSVMAMLEHGLPVVCVSMPWQPRGLLNYRPPSGIKEYRKGGLEFSLQGKTGLAFHNISLVSKQFVNSIMASV